MPANLLDSVSRRAHIHPPANKMFRYAHATQMHFAGTVVELLVKPGDQVSKGQPVAVLSSSELAQLRVESVQKRAEAEPDIQKAQSKSGVPLPWWWVLPVGSAIATGAFWLGRRSNRSSESFADQTSNGSQSPNGSAELPVSERVSEFSALAKNHHHHSSLPERD